MNDGSTNAISRYIKVPFHGADLFIVEHHGQPYVPMKPIVQAVGLDWKTQYRKLNGHNDHSGASRFCMVEITMQLPSDNQRRAVSCMPLRKLPGWLMSIDAGRVKDVAVRDRVMQYQAECDDALWQYWNEGIAVNPRIAFSVNPSDVLTGGEQDVLRRAVEGAAKHLPKEKRAAAIIKMWSKLKSHFKVSYREIPRAEFTEALSIVQRTAAEWEVVDQDPAPAGVQFIVPGHGRYLVVSSAGGAHVYNVAGFQLVAKDAALRMKLEMLALSEELARLKSRLRRYGGEDDPTVLTPVAFGMRMI